MSIDKKIIGTWLSIVSLIKTKDYKSSLELVLNFSQLPISEIDRLLALLFSAFIEFRLGQYKSSITYFNRIIDYEINIIKLKEVITSISFNGRSESKYKLSDFKEAVEDKKIAMSYKSFGKYETEIPQIISEFNLFDMKNIHEYTNILKTLINISYNQGSKYDLIQDYIKVINDNKKLDIIDKLIQVSDDKFKNRNYKSSIRALRRAERYIFDKSSLVLE